MRNNSEIENNGGAPVVSGAMDPALKAKWVEALRSGEYEQGRGALLRDGRYCCLGVLCVVSGRKIDGENSISGVSAGETYDLLGAITGLNDRFDELTNRNDGIGYSMKSFADLADYIEANIPTTDNSVTSSTDSREGSLCDSSLNNSPVSS